MLIKGAPIHNIPCKLGRYYGYWCPGTLHRQIVSHYSIEEHLSSSRNYSSTGISRKPTHGRKRICSLAFPKINPFLYQYNRFPYDRTYSIVCHIRLWSQIAKFMGQTWGPPGSSRPQMGPMLAPWALLSGMWYSTLADAYCEVRILIHTSIMRQPSTQQPVFLCDMETYVAFTISNKNLKYVCRYFYCGSCNRRMTAVQYKKQFFIAFLKFWLVQLE